MSAAEFAAWATGILAVLGILGILVKILLVAHRAANRLERVEALAAELEPNSGGSIKDTVHRTDQMVAWIKSEIESHEKRITRNEGRIEAIAMVTSPTVLVEETSHEDPGTPTR